MSPLPSSAADRERLETKITLALENAPEIHIPADFAARVASQMPPVVAVTLTRRRYGRNVAIACMGALLALILVLARRATAASPLWTSIVWILCVQFALMAVWLVARNLGPLVRWRH